VADDAVARPISPAIEQHCEVIYNVVPMQT